jgi:D-tyrosyl-tRNA(Tyr) deacylase
MLHAGLIIADVSALNANVFYELGLAHAIGKDTIILKQAASNVPADIGGAHYHQYNLQTLDRSKVWLGAEVSQWATNAHSEVVKSLRDG